MPAAWPSTVPAPVPRGLSIRQTDVRRSLRMDNGTVRRIQRGSGGPRAVTANFILTAAQFTEFRKFFLFDLGYGIDWFTAGWTAQLGFPGAQIRFTAPFRAVHRGPYSEVSAELEIQGDGGVVAVYSQPSQREDLDFGAAQTGTYTLDTWFEVDINDYRIANPSESMAGVTISSFGDVLAVATDASGVGTNEQISLYRRQMDGTYLQTGTIASPLPADSQFGWSLALSGSGLTLAVGTPSASTVHIYDLSNDATTATLRSTVGPPVVGDNGNLFGKNVNLSADGKYLSVVDILQQSGPNDPIVFVLFWDGTTWQPLDTIGQDAGGKIYKGAALSVFAERLILEYDAGLSPFRRYEVWDWNAATSAFDFIFEIAGLSSAGSYSLEDQSCAVSADGSVVAGHVYAGTKNNNPFPQVAVYDITGQTAALRQIIWYADDGDSEPEFNATPQGSSGLNILQAMRMSPNASHIAMMATVWPQNLPKAHVYIYKNS